MDGWKSEGIRWNTGEMTEQEGWDGTRDDGTRGLVEEMTDQEGW